MTTSEGWVKKIVKEMLDAHPCMYYHMVVQNGMGKPSLDFICCIYGMYVAIETKAPGNHMTDRQEITAKEMFRGGAEVIRDVGTDWASILGLYRRLFPRGTIPGAQFKRWARWFNNAGAKDAHQHAT